MIYFRCYGEKIAIQEGGEKGDILDVVQSLVSYLESQVRKVLISYVKGMGLNL